MKKIALFLAVLLVFGMVPMMTMAAQTPVEFEVIEQPERTPGVDCYEIFDNTSFEILDSPEALYYWGISSHIGKANSGLGSKVADRSEDAHSGKYSLKLMSDVDTGDVRPLVAPKLKPGETYEISGWVKKLTDCKNLVIYIAFEGSVNGVAQSYKRLSLSYNDVSVSDGWVKRAMRFVVPEGVKTTTIMLRLRGKGEMLWDDVSLLHITDKMPEPDVDPIKEPIKFLDIKNPGFEDDVVGQPTDPAKGWSPLKNVTVSDEYAHSGEKSVALRIVPGTGETDALIEMNVSGFENGATYQISAWFNNPEEYKVSPSFWINYSALDQFSYEPTTRLGQSKKHFTLRKTDGWVQLVHEFTPPDNVKSALIMVRLRVTPGVYYADDVSLYMVKAPDAVQGDTDETFYYSEWPEGYLDVSPYVMADPANSKAEFTFLDYDGATVINKKTFDSLATNVRYTFKTAWMKEIGKRYFVNMKVYGPDGAILQDTTYPVFRFDRPTYLGADGVFRKNGKETTITLGNGGKIETIERNPQEGGVTGILLISDTHVPVRERMDMAWERGLMCMVNLGSGNSCAGSKDRIESTKSFVNNVKDHPALFGYKVQDEPFQKGHTAEEMITAYEIIRNIDPHHPVYVDDSVQGSYSWLYRYSDIMDIDYYGAGSDNSGRVMFDVMSMAMEASKGRKPFTVLQQAFNNGGYKPTVDELRHIAYQSFFAGAHGYNFHSLLTDGSYNDEYSDIFMLRPEWQEIKEGWAKWERDFMYGCFVTRDYTYVNHQMTNDVHWATFTDGTDIYAIVLNREKKVAKEASIPLTDGMGTFKIADFTATTMTGEQKTLSGNGTLNVSLAPMEAVVWKITPAAKMDFSHLKSSKYRDTLTYPWAYNAIATLEEKGIINEMSYNWYGPQYNITRGDYAMFLVRTLGINVAPGENFVDVEADAEYAKELAIGKAAGIINGVGENRFNPEAEITRQDMMTMTSRAMQLAGTADLAAFSDSGAIADYAASHVSAMVAEGLIKGNADGTINPLGNTTRAEAAVIMNRILNK
ncbi:MAG: S-layer homology domain-containing protein [Clostridia bacterium]|nr:S-layer homology domain-containing protein [Clostridia bacterium]